MDEAEELLEEEDELSKSESLEADSSQSSRVSASSLAPRSLKKSTAFHDRNTLEQQVQCAMSLSTQGVGRKNEYLRP